MCDISKNSVSKQQKRPDMPSQIKYINGLFERSRSQHSDLFHYMRLWIKWRKTKEQNKRDEKFVFQQVFHYFFSFGTINA
jgi:hypothetical protein